MKETPKVFISYSYQDKEFVHKLVKDLAAEGINPWFDDLEIRPGDSLIEKISDGIRQSDYILVVLSENSLQSKWVQEEIKMAFQKNSAGAKRVLIPVLHGKVEVPRYLRDIKYVNLSESYQEGIDEVIRTIQGRTSQEKPQPSQLVDAGGLAKEIAKELSHILKVDSQGIRINNGLSEYADPKLVFVIMANTTDLDPIFKGIQAAGNFHGLHVERVKDVLGDYRITDKIIEKIHKARLIVADLTHERPNVYFELGYARGIEKTVITIARKSTRLHFDVKDWNCMFYNDSRILEQDLKERFSFELEKT